MCIDLIALFTMYCVLNIFKYIMFLYTLLQDGVRLGCYGYEVEGKQYVTQYVADSRGYRLVTTEDQITVYPKYGAPEG